MDEFIHSGQPRTVRECLEEARNATSPADTVRHLFVAIAYQQQQIEQLELAVGVQQAEATEGVRARARKLADRAASGY